MLCVPINVTLTFMLPLAGVYNDSLVVILYRDLIALPRKTPSVVLFFSSTCCDLHLQGLFTFKELVTFVFNER